MNNFAVYHQCFNNLKATEFAISKFREYNPDVKYYLISDGGDDFKSIADKYNCIYVHDKRNIGLKYLPHDSAKILIERITTFFNTVNTDYGLYMEDDVLCRNKITLTQDFNISMLRVYGNKLSVYNTIKKYNSRPNVDWYGGCGGTFWNKNIFTMPQYVDIINQFFANDYNYCCGTIDELLPTLYLICGLECSENPFLSDIYQTPNSNHEQYHLIHNYKNMY
jgi:hypothetical protein